MICCQLSWFPRHTAESRKHSSPVSKVTPAHHKLQQSLAIFPLFLNLFLLLPSSPSLLHVPTFRSTTCWWWKTSGCPGKTSVFTCVQSCAQAGHKHSPETSFCVLLSSHPGASKPKTMQYTTKYTVRWTDGGTVGLPLSISHRRISSCSPAAVCTIIQAGLNPSSLHPFLSPSLLLTLTLPLSDSLMPYLFSTTLWPTVFLVLLFFLVVLLFLFLCLNCSHLNRFLSPAVSPLLSHSCLSS